MRIVCRFELINFGAIGETLAGLFESKTFLKVASVSTLLFGAYIVASTYAHSRSFDSGTFGIFGIYLGMAITHLFPEVSRTATKISMLAALFIIPSLLQAWKKGCY